METTAKNTSKALNISLWIAQLILAAMFIMAGLPKITTPIQELAASNEIPEALVRFIGIAELLGAAGLLLPGILNIKPVLTSYAALGLFTIMVLAFLYHISKGEYAGAGITVALGLLAAFVAWGRFIKAPASSKAISHVSN
ncbi:DoxX family protein [Rhodocytophaga aerolata]|uniref:DoxX family protein n=1 Tax=Rhodocytophaga aerolata TaxID=455078 RepID=A0ABT8RB01_9BACT|nr:DoxX family protein [Rhodocytophaga aerolata]MDO1448418.1 DoxX family protein [Rhodocytophaga aerolata]